MREAGLYTAQPSATTSAPFIGTTRFPAGRATVTNPVTKRVKSAETMGPRLLDESWKCVFLGIRVHVPSAPANEDSAAPFAGCSSSHQALFVPV